MTELPGQPAAQRAPSAGERHTALLVELRSLRLRVAELETEVARLPHVDRRVADLEARIAALRGAPEVRLTGPLRRALRRVRGRGAPPPT